jgi:hypothetical protein
VLWRRGSEGGEGKKEVGVGRKERKKEGGGMRGKDGANLFLCHRVHLAQSAIDNDERPPFALLLSPL